MAELKARDPRTTRYPAELRERAVRMFYEVVDDTGQRHGAVLRVARALGVGTSAVRHWVRDFELQGGQRPGVPIVPSAAEERIRELERENRELRRANEILKSASAFFAAELDRRQSS
jgi:transposase